MNQFFRLFSWSKIIFKVQSYGHSSDSTSISHFFFNGLRHITLRTVTYHHACNMVMIEVILCAASLSLCYTATCYGNDECIGSCWCMGDSKYKESTLHSQARRTQIQWRRPSEWGLQHNGLQDMHKQILTCWYKAIILIGFPLLHMYSWCQSSAVDANWHTDKRLCSFHEISMSCTNIAK